ncbi:MAG: hypothetical protein ACRC6N_00050 [Plesiomonas sp.]|uniref:hypothetical protein n=1 Tax=Plesiomonas sp. TaxID=2486279 RepID=UPI003F2C004E
MQLGVTACPSSSSSEQLFHLRQGADIVQDYTIHFCTLVATSGWNDQALITAYRQGLEPSLRLHLAVADDSLGL